MRSFGANATMYQDHPVFEKPENQDAKIWRYMDLTKFLSLLHKKALFFVRADKLADPLEGSYSRANVTLRAAVYPKEVLSLVPQMQEFHRRLLKCTVINSWHMNEFESAAMWKLYLKSDEGVAAQSTFKRLKECLSEGPETAVYVGKVKYIDYNTEWLPEGNTMYPFVHKRKSFEHEREVRAVVQMLPMREGPAIDWSREAFGDGLYVPVNLNTLIEKVYVSPSSADWFLNLVKSVVERYGLNKEVVRSSLAEGPVY